MKSLANSSGFIVEAIARLPDPHREPRNLADEKNQACVSRYLASLTQELDQGAPMQLAAERSRSVLCDLNSEELSAIEWIAVFVLLDGVNVMRYWQGEAGNALEAFLSALIQITEKRGRTLSNKEFLNLFIDHAAPLFRELCSLGLWTEESLQKPVLKSRLVNLNKVENDLKLIAGILSRTGKPCVNAVIDRMVPVLDLLKWKSPASRLKNKFCKLCSRPAAEGRVHCKEHQRKGRRYQKDHLSENNFHATVDALCAAVRVIPSFLSRFQSEIDNVVFDAAKKLENSELIQLLNAFPDHGPKNPIEQRIRFAAYEICDQYPSCTELCTELIAIAELLAEGIPQKQIEQQLNFKPRTLSTKLKRVSVLIDLVKIPEIANPSDRKILASNPRWRLWPFGYRPEAHYTNRSSLLGARYVGFGLRDPSRNLVDWQEEANKSAGLDANTTIVTIEKFAAKKNSTKISTSAS